MEQAAATSRNMTKSQPWFGDAQNLRIQLLAKDEDRVFRIGFRHKNNMSQSIGGLGFAGYRIFIL